MRSLAALEPDFVVNSGDNLAHVDAVPPLLRAMEPLLERPGAFVLGSNDYFAPRPKNPALYLELQQAGKLNELIRERADEIRSEISTLTMEMSAKDRAKTSDPMAVASLLKGHEAAAREIVLAEMLEFPQDESPSSG